ncbi:MAG: Lpg1974 family pore-forming outer membrane protein [Chlamydiales bacterium]|nr:Lpg1974 family pore-forming outer membrane protein [Chlamydiales bacterium]
MNVKFLLNAAVILTSGFLFAQNSESAENRRNAREPTCSAPEPRYFMQGEPISDCCPSGFNTPAAIDVCPKIECMDWQTNGFIDLSFLYWYVGEEGMSLASDGVLNAGTAYYSPNMVNHRQTFDYHPGFKLSLGVVGDHQWEIFAEYTWLRGKNTTHLSPSSNTTTAGTSAAFSGTPVLVVDDWFLQGTGFGQGLSASGLDSSWRYGVDILDVGVSRPFYEGASLTVAPYTGLRALWIRQHMTVQLTEVAALFSSGALAASEPLQPIHSHNISNCWGLGPKLGVEADFLIPMGFRVEGDAGVSLLYTRYTTVSHSEDQASTAFSSSPYQTSLNDYSCLRPIAELSLGAGWGSYFGGSAYHVDFSASYDFTMLWSQNMMRNLLDTVLTGTSASPGDMYFHGLTLKGRLDF